MKRYFIVVYTGQWNGNPVTGQINLTTSSGYISRRGAVKTIEQAIKINYTVITNVIELTENDYKNWVSTAEVKTNYIS